MNVTVVNPTIVTPTPCVLTLMGHMFVDAMKDTVETAKTVQV